MSVSPRHSSARPGWFPRERQLASLGISLVVAGKLADAATTVVGLYFVSGVTEHNPLARALMADIGVAPALLVLVVLPIALVILVTEICAAVCRRQFTSVPTSPLLVRAVGYGIPAGSFIAVSVHNVTVIAGGLGLG